MKSPATGNTVLTDSVYNAGSLKWSLWCYAYFSNNSIIDFEGNLKPAAIELKKIWKNRQYISAVAGSFYRARMFEIHKHRLFY